MSGNTPHSSENPDWLNSSELSLKFSKKSNWLFQWILGTHFSGTFSTISSPGSSDGPSPVNARDDFLNESLMIRTQIRMEHLRFLTLSIHRMNSLGNSGTARSIIFSIVLKNIHIFYRICSFKQAQYPNLLCLYPAPIPSLVAVIPKKILKGFLQ